MLVLSSCWYKLNCKFNEEKYKVWINNFLNNINNFYLVIYTNKDSYKMIKQYEDNSRIKIILLDLEEFYNYKYKDFWIKNHEKNYLLNTKICWEVNMLWAEKISFVKRTIDNKYFNGEWFGWCDIGYFRGRDNDIPNQLIKQWPNPLKIQELNNSKIYYAKVNNNQNVFNSYMRTLLDKNVVGLPKNIIPYDQISIAGGFFLIHNTKIDWWHTMFDNKLKLYFDNDRLVKDDQIIVLDNICCNIANFVLVEERTNYDNWFLFQRYLM